MPQTAIPVAEVVSEPVDFTTIINKFTDFTNNVYERLGRIERNFEQSIFRIEHKINAKLDSEIQKNTIELLVTKATLKINNPEIYSELIAQEKLLETTKELAHNRNLNTIIYFTIGTSFCILLYGFVVEFKQKIEKKKEKEKDEEEAPVYN